MDVGFDRLMKETEEAAVLLAAGSNGGPHSRVIALARGAVGDLRRAFGTRWAKRVMPAVLQRLMRHSSVETTMKFYVTHEANDLAADLWEKFGSGDHLGDHDQKEADGAATEVVEISPQELS